MQALANLYRDTVSIVQPGAADLYGRPTASATTTATARVVQKTRTLYFPATGKTLTTSAVVYFRDPVALSLDDRIALPGESAPRVPLLIEQAPDETGRMYAKAWIQ